MWVPPEDKDPVTLHAPTRKSIALFGAVNILTGKLVYMIIPKFNGESCIAFLKKLIMHRRKKRKMVIIPDNARYHHAHIIHQSFENHCDNLRLEFLPPYSLILLNVFGNLPEGFVYIINISLV